MEIGISRGGRSIKLHALIESEGRPLRFLLTSGNAADAKAPSPLPRRAAARAIVLGDKAYDANPIRHLIEEQVPVPNIPPRRTTAGKAAFGGCSTEAQPH